MDHARPRVARSASLLVLAIATSLAIATNRAVAQTGRTMSLVGAPAPGTSFQTVLSYPTSAAGNIYTFLWSTPYVGSYPVVIPGLTVYGNARVNAFTLLLLETGIYNASGSTAMTLTLPNNPSLVGASLDCQGADFDFPQQSVYLSDNDLELVVSDHWAVRTKNDAVSSNYVVVGNAPSLQPQNLTLDATFKPLGQGLGVVDPFGMTLVAKPIQGVGGDYIYSWTLNWSPATNLVSVHVSHDGSTQGVDVYGTTPITPGTWARATATVDGSNVQLYVNGALQASVPWSFASIYYGNDDVLFGAANYAGSFARRFDGAIDQVSIWNRALTGAEITQIQTTIAAANGLLGLWNFELSLLDASGNGHDGTSVGTATYTPGQ